ncbi:3-hydroxyacyl-CoA dehydrogenase family protein [Polynucleobacter necessarius]|uniref:3-hydroxyacyl-CoA dehydrogenase family protein n=1 Tax=Polynucleobacter necessarius TaxID=576610 RepID=UPI001E40CD25|nr:3-hydroxyacyl-CoA dehydrogenase family protein [Polynucleobacter necessarius]
MTACGMVPVTVKKDLPGFLVNRLQHALSREAFAMVDAGICTPEDIDKAVRFGFGFREIAAGPAMNNSPTTSQCPKLCGIGLFQSRSSYIDKLNAAANEALKNPQLRELMLSQGNEIGGGNPAEFTALIKSDASKWSVVVKSANIKPE